MNKVIYLKKSKVKIKSKHKKPIEKISFLENARIFCETSERVLNYFKRNVFPIEN